MTLVGFLVDAVCVLAPVLVVLFFAALAHASTERPKIRPITFVE